MINKTGMIFSKKVFTFADFGYEKEKFGQIAN